MHNFYPFVFITMIGINLLASQEIQSSIERSQKVSIFENKLEFTGWQGDYVKTENINEIRIGLFIPENPDNKNHISINRAADLAIGEINKTGGFKGIPFRLIRRWSDDRWGAGSKEVIKLVYKDSVWAIIGSIDGDATHVAEQITTKAFLPLISPISADPTLNYSRIPWMFRLPPDYQSQAKLILKKCLEIDLNQRIGLISTTSHDGRVFSSEIKEALHGTKQTLAFHFEVSSSPQDISELLKRSLTFNPDGLIIFLSNNGINKALSYLKKIDFKKPIYIPWIPDLKSELFAGKIDGNIYLVEPFSQNHRWVLFKQKYFHHFGNRPTMGAAFMYDAIYLLVYAIKKAGLNRAAIRDALHDTDYVPNVIGNILWDNAGGNKIYPVFRKTVIQ